MNLFKRLLDFGLWILPYTPGQKPFNLFPGHHASNTYSLPPGCVNSREHRACWRDGFNITTDYELATPPGKLVEYDLTLTKGAAYPDGYIAPAMLINGVYPGPTIEAEWGDTVRVTVHNKLTNHNGTAIHWHGVRQFETNWEDGVAGVTQCPITPGMTQVYEFRATQYGTSWYHSHFSLQYADGVLGALHIKGPTSKNYDEELEPLLVSDWYHEDAFSLYHTEEDGSGPPIPDSNILNGKGVYPCDPVFDPRCTGRQFRHEIYFTAGRTYKLSIINTAVFTQFKFWIDGHNFTVVQTDFVPVDPYEASFINIGIGQRYDFIVKADANFAHGTNFWIHARDCGDPSQTSTLGIIRYDRGDHQDPYTPVPNLVQSSSDCSDEDPSKLHPIVTRTVTKNVNGLGPADYLEAGLQGYPNTSVPWNQSALTKWVLANSSLYIDWRDPSLKLLTIDKDRAFPPQTSPIFLDFDTGDWVYFLILNNYNQSNTPRGVINTGHPLHLHGHDFVILAQSSNLYDPSVPIHPKLDNPARRDVAMLPAGGYLFIGFQVDNPGAWLMHCHIAWHASGGLGLQFIEQPSKIKGLMQKAGVFPSFKERCGLWSEYYGLISEPANATQEDSGI